MELTTRARELETRANAAVRIEFTQSAQTPTRALLMYAEMHSETIEVFELEVHQGSASLRRLRVQTPPEPRLTDDPLVAETSDVASRPETAHEWLEQLWLLAGARLAIAPPEAEPGEIALRPLLTTSLQHSYVLRVQGEGNEVRERRYAGYGSNLDAAEYVPLELAWRTLSRLEPAWRAGLSTESERRALADVWSASGSLPAWQLSPMLALAAAVPSPKWIPQLMQALDSSDPSIRTLAANALAATTGQDFRREADGTARPLEEVVSAYKQLR